MERGTRPPVRNELPSLSLQLHSAGLRRECNGGGPGPTGTWLLGDPPNSASPRARPLQSRTRAWCPMASSPGFAHPVHVVQARQQQLGACPAEGGAGCAGLAQIGGD